MKCWVISSTVVWASELQPKQSFYCGLEVDFLQSLWVFGHKDTGNVKIEPLSQKSTVGGRLLLALHLKWVELNMLFSLEGRMFLRKHDSEYSRIHME